MEDLIFKVFSSKTSELSRKKENMNGKPDLGNKLQLFEKKKNKGLKHLQVAYV